MKLSALQKFILLKCLEKGTRVDRKIFRNFYETQNKKAKEKYQESIITKSLEHLIDRELMTGYGRRTPHKWFITHVSLTKKGTKISQDLLNERQEKLPLK